MIPRVNSEGTMIKHLTLVAEAATVAGCLGFVYFVLHVLFA